VNGQRSKRGAPQGSGISPRLANVFLHYSFDAWIHQWRTRHARRQIVVIRYADAAIVGAQYESDARRLLDALRERLAKFGLALNEDKTRLIEFGRFAAQRRAQAGLRRPETFNFLGFTHYCGATRSGKFMVKRKTQATRMARKLTELRAELRKRWQPEIQDELEAVRPSAKRASAPEADDPSSLAWSGWMTAGLSRRAGCPKRARPDPWGESQQWLIYPTIPHPGICGGGGRQRPSLLRWRNPLFGFGG
jgi:hypothetical protein